MECALICQSYRAAFPTLHVQEGKLRGKRAYFHAISIRLHSMCTCITECAVLHKL